MPGMDIFNASAFTMQSLTTRLIDAPHIPMRLGELGIFNSQGVRTTSITIERQGNTLVLVPTSPRGTPATQNTKDARDIRILPTHRIALEDTISADEVQNVRAFGSETDLDSLVAEVDRRNARMDRSIVATEEFHRIGAMKGTILDADGSTLHNLFTVFGVIAQTEVDFAMAAADNPADDGSLGRTCAEIIRAIEDELGGLPYSGIHAMCSRQFFDDLIAHPEYRATFKNWPEAVRLRERAARMVRTVSYGGIDFEEYRGAVGGTKYVADDKAHFFPIGVPELFETFYAPAEYWDTVNTLGLPRYSRLNPDGTDPDHKRTIRTQSQFLTICTRPRVLVPAKRT